MRYVLAGYIFLSLGTFAAYWFDKRRAQSGGWRVSERTLHPLALLGGWPGALLAQRFIRHKNRKIGFQTVPWVIVGIHLAAGVGGCFQEGADVRSLLPVRDEVTRLYAIGRGTDPDATGQRSPCKFCMQDLRSRIC